MAKAIRNAYDFRPILPRVTVEQVTERRYFEAMDDIEREDWLADRWSLAIPA